MIWSLSGQGRVLDFRSRVQIMGILNVTPDSFYDGGRHYDVGSAVEKALELQESGADVIDVGGESSRPSMYGIAECLSVEDELDRVIPVIEALRSRSQVPLSIDTTKSQVARAALLAGADIVNDISALTGDDAMAATVSELKSPLILMHRRGNAATMQLNTHYDDLIAEISNFLVGQINIAAAAGIEREMVAVDPGLGFGKAAADNFVLIAELGRFAQLDCPIVVGASRKSFLWKPLGLSPEKCLEPSLAAAALAAYRGAHMIRVHDVKSTIRAVRTVEAIIRASPNGFKESRVMGSAK